MHTHTLKFCPFEQEKPEKFRDILVLIDVGDIPPYVESMFLAHATDDETLDVLYLKTTRNAFFLSNPCFKGWCYYSVEDCNA
jgi:hypothetical protein